MPSRDSSSKLPDDDLGNTETDAEGRFTWASILELLRRQKLHIAFFITWVFGAYLALGFDPSALQLYVIVTVFYLIFTNLGERRSGLSAYSVFNRNCERIMGQSTAEQFDNEVRRRAVYVYVHSISYLHKKDCTSNSEFSNDDDVLANIATSTLQNLVAV